MSQANVDFKCVLLGRSNVGKTCLVERFLHNSYKDDSIATVGAAFGAKELKINDKKVTIGVWDTAGSERYEAMTRHYYNGADAAIICFDLTNRESWDKVKFWHTQVTDAEPNVTLIIVGTKSDLLLSSASSSSNSKKDQRLPRKRMDTPHNNTDGNQQGSSDMKQAVVTSEEIRVFCNYTKAIYVSTSAKTNINVNEPFIAASEAYLKKPPKTLVSTPTIGLGDLENTSASDKEKNTSTCCGS